MHAGGRPSNRKRPELGERIAQARERAGLSQYDLAERLGVSQQQVVRWERIVSSVRTDSLTRIAIALNTSCDELLGFTPPSRRRAPTRLQRLVDEISELPSRQQNKLIDQIETVVAGHKVRQGEKRASRGREGNNP